MKRKTLFLILAAETVLLAVLSLLPALLPAFFSSLLAFPLEQAGLGVKALAETGALGNGLALAIAAGLCLLPVLFSFRCPCGKDALPEKVVLWVLSAVLAVAFWGVISPGAFSRSAIGNTDGYAAIIRGFFNICAWSVVVLFFVLRLIRLFRAGSREQLLRYLRTLMCLLAMSFTAVFVVSAVAEVRGLIDTEPSAADAFIGILRLLAQLVPYVFDLVIVLRVIALLDLTSDGVGEAASRLSSVSCTALAVTTGITVLQYLAQIPFLSSLSAVSANLDIPLVSITFVVVILLFSRLLVENQKLREDNSLFI